MSLLTLRAISLGFGGPPVLESIDLQIEAHERLCLVGRNGEGKSTLLKLIADDLKADEGEIQKKRGLNIASLAQEAPADLTCSTYEVVADGLGEQGKLLARYNHISHQVSEGQENLLDEMAHVQHALEIAGGWQLSQRVEATLSRFELPPDVVFSDLSGGLKRRVLLARALISEPDLLMLDEPTNHLDIEAIRWLEDFLLDFKGALLFITHDRALIQKLATRIVELDRGRLTSWPGDYQTYLSKKQEVLEAEATREALFDKKLAQEERWIRQGIKARRTRNEGRVRALKQLRKQHSMRRSRTDVARIKLNDMELSGKLVFEVDKINHRYGDETIIHDFSTLILRGDKIGILGPNGSGKTTLLDILLGKLTPESGKIKVGTKLEIAYFDQHRRQLKEDQSIIDNVADGSDMITVNGKSRHVISYLQDFLFSPERARTPVRALSGGERNRLLLAKLFARPSNLLVMDEPTNDLDIETLELLEELLLEYTGTLLLVSHDRVFIDNVVTSTLVLEGDGKIAEYTGGYQDWLRQRNHKPQRASTRNSTPDISTESQVSSNGAQTQRSRSRQNSSRKISYKDQQELDTLPDLIEKLEQEQQQLQKIMAEPAFYQRAAEDIAADKRHLEVIEKKLNSAYLRWEGLEGTHH